MTKSVIPDEKSYPPGDHILSVVSLYGPAVALKEEKNLYLGQYLSHKLLRAFNCVLHMLTDLITSNIFG